MKNLNRLFALLAVVAVAFSCVEDDDFNLPDTAPSEADLDGPVVTISAIKGALDQEITRTGDDSAVLEFGDTDQYLEGFVVSSDEGGNFFEEIYIQNSSETATAGLRIAIDDNPLFTTFESGRKIFVKLNNLAIGIDSGVYTIGVVDGNEVGQIPGTSKDEVLIRSTVVETLVPTPVSLGMLNDDLVGTYVIVDDVQFSRADVIREEGPKTFAAESTDRFDGERQLVSCANGASAVFSTSTFADFKTLDLPTGRGSLAAVLTYNFFGDTYNLVVNTPEALDMQDPNRCDPDFLECGNPNAGTGTNRVFFQNFEAIFDESQLDALGWTNVNVSGGTERYEDGNFSNNRYIQINAFGQSDDPLIAWLVTPAINFDNSTDEALSFDIQANFDEGGLLEVYVTNDYTGDPTTTTWQQVEANIPQGPANGFASSFSPVDNLDISCIDGTDVRVAFRYTGSDPAGTLTRYHIDNIEVTGN